MKQRVVYTGNEENGVSIHTKLGRVSFEFGESKTLPGPIADVLLKRPDMMTPKEYQEKIQEEAQLTRDELQTEEGFPEEETEILEEEEEFDEEEDEEEVDEGEEEENE